jgi:small GTP-binding protein
MKPELILKLEKQLKIHFKEVDILEISEWKVVKTFEYSIDQNKNITGLCISGFDLKKIPTIIASEAKQSLQRLTYLNLNGNQISDISSLKELKNLTQLDFSFNKIIDISSLKELNNLTVLFLYGNQITDISDLEELNNLTELNLGNNQISEISVLKKLKKLTILRLHTNKIQKILVLKDLIKLTDLTLSDNQISDIKILKELVNLKRLIISGNQITDISSLKELKKLTEVILRNNPIKELPEWICDFPKMDIKWKKDTWDYNYITFFDNPIETPPIEIVKQGKEAIKNWFAANKKELKEIKVILIGEAKAGKTSLLRRLQKNEYNPNEQQTDGIIIETFDFEKLPTFKEQKKLHGIKAYFWDFGGQEIMSSTHQFFLTNRSVYILVLDARKDEKTDNQVRDWLKRIQTFGGNSPVIVVGNKIDLNESFGLNTYELLKDFPQIKGFVNVSCEKNTGLSEIKNLLEESIPQAELFKTKIDERWFPVKSDLQKLTSQKQYITQKEFEEICNKNNLENESEQIQAIKFLNDLGIVLHFSDLRMSEFFVLDPYWVTTGVYRIITSAFAATKKGEILLTDLKFIVNEEERKKEAYIPENQKKLKYSPNELCYLSEIMAEFKLSYFSENREKIQIPDLLDVETPAKEAEMFLHSKDKLNLIYQYDYLPVSIIHFFMVEMKRDIKKAWRTGVILNCKSNIEAQAIVVASENKISISVIGEHRHKRDYLSIIRFFIDKVNSNFSLITNLAIPLPDTKNKTVKYIVLSNMEKKGESIYTDWEIGKDYNISELLNGVVNKEIIQRQAQTINYMYVLGDNNSLLQDINAKNIDFKGKSKEEVMKLLYEKFISEFDKLHNRHDQHDEDFGKTYIELNEIKQKIDLSYEKIITQLKENKIDTIKIEEIIENINNKNEQTIIEVGQNILGHINWAFEEYGKEFDESLQEVYENLKTTDNWTTKIKLSVPFLNLIGIKIEHEVKLNKYIKWIYNTF